MAFNGVAFGPLGSSKIEALADAALGVTQCFCPVLAENFRLMRFMV